MPVDKPSWKTPLFAMKLAAILLIGILLLGIYLKTEPNPDTGLSPIKPMDSSRLTLYDQKIIDLSAFNLPRSELLLVSFWASWCPTCKPELKQLNDFLNNLDSNQNTHSALSKNQLNTNKLKSISINLNPLNEKTKVLELWKSLNLKTELILGGENNLLDTYIKSFEIDVLPSYLLIKDNKTVLLKIDGATNWNLKKNQKIITDYLNQAL